MTTAEIGVFGGSGFYSFLDDVEQVELDTPYGKPSTSLAVGKVDGRSVAFLPRHGTGHEIPAHKVNFKANLWAMRMLGVTRIIGPCAAGSLQPNVEPGHTVILDQLVDRTHSRGDTYFDGPELNHISLADPYCPELRTVLSKSAAETGIPFHEQGTVVVIQGPRFSTRAESRWYRSAGWEVINMTQYPEVALARELGICYAGVALITDYDSGLEGVDHIKPVEMAQVFAMLKANVELTRNLLMKTFASIPQERSCSCVDTLNNGPLSRGR